MRRQRTTILGAYREWLQGLKGTYLFRGHVPYRLLSTSLEHACADWGIPSREAPHVETALIREFRRSYTGPDHPFVDTDTLYCMALMRHHGAPVRLLDFTYSPFIAAYFALTARGKDERLVCAIRQDFILAAAKQICGNACINARNDDRKRNDGTLLKMYMQSPAKRFVFAENAVRLGDNVRLRHQQGVFLCPGDVSRSFEHNLDAMKPRRNDVLRFALVETDADPETRAQALEELHRYTLNHRTLFPGPDGLCESLYHRTRFFLDPTLRGRP